MVDRMAASTGAQTGQGTAALKESPKADEKAPRKGRKKAGSKVYTMDTKKEYRWVSWMAASRAIWKGRHSAILTEHWTASASAVRWAARKANWMAAMTAVR